MAGNAAGEIVINTKLDNKDFMSDSKRMLSMIKNMHSSLAQTGKGLTSAVAGYSAAMGRSLRATRKAKAQIAELTEEAAKMREELNRRGEASGAKQFFDLRKELKAVEKEYYAAIAASEKLAETDGVDSTAYKQAEEQVEKLAIKLSELDGKMEKAPRPSDDEILAYHQQEQAIQQVEEALTDLREQQQELGGFGATIKNVASAAGAAAVAVAKMAGHGALSFLKKLASGAKNAAIQLAKLAASAAKSGISKLSSLLGGAVKSILGFNRAQNAASGGLKVGLKNILKYAFGIRSLFYLFRRLRAAISEGFGELKKHNPEVKSALDGLQKALNGLKGSLASAFAPILTAVAPALTTLINLLTNAVNAIGAFFAALTGRSSFQRAVGTVTNIGKAVGGAAKKAKELKRELAGFDELNILKDQSSGGGGSGGGGTGYTYETVPVSSAILDFVRRLKELWANGEYEEVGAVIAEGVNNAFVKAKELISWENVKDTVTEAVDAIAGVFNGFVTGVHWWLIGATVGAAFNTIIQSANRLLTDVEWEQIGTAIGDFFTGIKDQVKPEDLAALFVHAFDGALRLLKTFLNTLFQMRLGVYVAKAINSIFDNDQLFDDAAGLFNRALIGALQIGEDFVREFHWKDAGEKIKEALQKIKWKEIAQHAWDLFKKALAGIADFISALFSDNELKPIIKPGRQRRNDRLGQYTDAGTGAKPSEESGLSGSLGNAVSNVLRKLDEWINAIPWTDFGGELGDALSDLPWADWGVELAKALNDLFLNLDDFVSTAIYGENYKDNAIWQTTHPEKYAKYQAEQRYNDDPYIEQALKNLGYTFQDYIDLNSFGHPGEDFDKLVEIEKERLRLEQQNTTPDDIVTGFFEALHESGATKAIEWLNTLIGSDVPIENIISACDQLGLAADQLVEKTAESFPGEWPTQDVEYESEALEYYNKAIEDGIISFGDDLVRIKDALELVFNGSTPQEAGDQVQLNASNMQKLYDIIAQYPEIVQKSILAADDQRAYNAPDQTSRTPLAKAIDAAFFSFGEVLGINARAEESTVGKSAKETEKLTKAEKKQTKLLGSLNDGIDLNVDGQSLGKITGDGRAQATVTVGFVPQGADEEEEPTGLLAWLQAIFAPGVQVLATLFTDSTSGTLAGLFGTVLAIVAFLTGKDISSLTFGDIFGTVLSVLAALTGQQTTGDGVFSSLAAIFGTWFGVKSALTGQQTTGNGVLASLGAVFGTWFGVKSALTGRKEGSNTLQSVYLDAKSKALNFVSSLTGKKDGTKTLKDLYLNAKSKALNFVSNLTARKKGSNTLKNVYGAVHDLVSNLTGRKKGTNTVADIYGTTLAITATISTTREAIESFIRSVRSQLPSWMGGTAATGGIITANGIKRFASGGSIRKAASTMFGGINRYASGTARAHGTLFLAGEAGAEVVGHVGGKTEVLNRSQIAQSIYSAVVAGMSQAVNALGKYLANHMSVCSNAIITTIGTTFNPATLQGINFHSPAMINGNVMPYDVAAQIARSAQDIQDTLNMNNTELIQTVADVTNTLNSVAAMLVRAIQKNGNGTSYTTQKAIDEINRRTLMFNASPLK